MKAGKGVTKLLEKARLDGRSWLYRWLYTHHAELAPVLNGLRPPWVALARTIRNDPEWTGNEAGPSRQAVRDTWLRVEKDKAASAISSTAPSRMSTTTPPPVRAQAPLVESPPHPVAWAVQPDPPDDDQPDLNSFVKERR
ncbi:MAG: hypothetical protein ABSC06_29415 [Rhodopila sp.]|jgi:hypothetical protein